MLTNFDLSTFRIEIKTFFIHICQDFDQNIHVLTEGSAVRLTEQAGRGWVSQMFVRRWWVLSLLSLILIFWSVSASCNTD